MFRKNKESKHFYRKFLNSLLFFTIMLGSMQINFAEAFNKAGKQTYIDYRFQEGYYTNLGDYPTIAISGDRMLVFGLTQYTHEGNYKTHEYSEANLNFPASYNRYYSAITEIGEGKFLMVGGDSTNGEKHYKDVYIYDSNSGTLTPKKEFPITNAIGTAVNLKNGKVLVAGGQTNARYSGISNAYIYDITKNTWSEIARMNQARYNSEGVLLPDGRVWIIGGNDFDYEGDNKYYITTTEIYDIETNTWEYGPELPFSGRYFNNTTAILLDDNRLLVLGDNNLSGVNNIGDSYIYYIDKGEWEKFRLDIRLNHGFTKAVKLDGEQILFLEHASPYRTLIYDYSFNKPPVTPGSFTSPTSTSNLEGGQSITIKWGASTDPEGDPIKYQLDFYNGSTWSTLNGSLTSNQYSWTVPTNVTTSSAKLRVRAIDATGCNEWSSYKESSIFSIYQNKKPILANVTLGENRTFHNQDKILIEGFIQDADLGDKNTIFYSIDGTNPNHTNKPVTLTSPTQILATGNNIFFKSYIKLDQTINPGEYTFKIWGKDNKGADSNVIEIPITINNALEEILKNLKTYTIQQDNFQLMVFGSNSTITKSAINDSLVTQIKAELQSKNMRLYFIGTEESSTYIDRELLQN